MFTNLLLVWEINLIAYTSENSDMTWIWTRVLLADVYCSTADQHCSTEPLRQANVEYKGKTKCSYIVPYYWSIFQNDLLWCVLFMGSHSFTCCQTRAIPAFTPHLHSITTHWLLVYSLCLAVEGWPGWVDLGGWMFSAPGDMITHPNTNRAEHSASLSMWLITLLICQTNRLALMKDTIAVDICRRFVRDVGWFRGRQCWQTDSTQNQHTDACLLAPQHQRQHGGTKHRSQG